MINFEHEVGNIKDRSLRHFLGTDYFHDGLVKDIRVNGASSMVEITVSDNRQWKRDFGLQRGYNAANPKHAAYIRKMGADKYLYKLQFKGCRHFVAEAPGGFEDAEFINARFKDSVLVRQINEAERRRHLHLRIQLSDRGFIDVIFRKFAIVKRKGAPKIPSRTGPILPFGEARWFVQTWKWKGVKDARRQAFHGDWLQRSIAITFLALKNDIKASEAALLALEVDDAYLNVSAVHALGCLGLGQNLHVLAREARRAGSTSPIYRRHVQDAIDKILYGNKIDYSMLLDQKVSTRPAYVLRIV